MPAPFASAETAVAFAKSGKAILTLEGRASRFTFRINKADRSEDMFFVSVLTGADNENDYEYFGLIRGDRFNAGNPAKVRVTRDAPSAAAFAWAWERLAKGRLPDGLKVYHMGRCGRCARTLTVPSSIESGIGPECARKA